MSMSSIDVAAGPRKQKLAGHGGKEQVAGERLEYKKREGKAVDEGRRPLSAASQTWRPGGAR